MSRNAFAASSPPSPDRQAVEQEVAEELRLTRQQLEGINSPVGATQAAELGDRATQRVEAQLAVDQVQRLQRRLTELEATLQRLEDGTWGTCEECGRPISAERLEVVVTAATCMNHATV